MNRGAGDAFPDSPENVRPRRCWDLSRLLMVGKNLMNNPYQMRTLILMVMQMGVVISLITQAVIVYRDIHWNNALNGSSTISFSTRNSTWQDRYISWDDGNLQQLLRRHLTLPLLALGLIIILLVYNLVALVFDWHNLRLMMSIAVYSIFGVTLFSLALGYIFCTQNSTLTMYEPAAERLLELVPLDDDTLPYQFPQGNPISVRKYPQYFLQIMYSCQQGSVDDWERKSDLMGITPTQIHIPSYRQLVKMGFCTHDKFVLVPVALLFCLGALSWSYVSMSLIIRKMGLMLASNPPSQQDIKVKEFEASVRAIGGKLEDV